ncbi:helix-turn-helix domain-containing protein [uncultured Dubosiella sp.]|uniref:helix-turn-helix domain-containing protein n=1 Tax=uncultured Dubosiella sp. TaxID=1937011 RepID=UPI0025B4B10C|nr:helix-turn-helix domain-containing protein [uncultured Dubosiella sp.]
MIEKRSELTIREIKKAVSQFYGLSYADLEGKSRLKQIMNARHICVYLSREMLHKPYMQIGKDLGNRDHTTIQSSYNRACELMKKDNAFRMAVDKIKEKLM